MIKVLEELFGPRTAAICDAKSAMRRNLIVVCGRNVRKTPAKTLWVPIPMF